MVERVITTATEEGSWANVDGWGFIFLVVVVIVVVAGIASLFGRKR